MKTTIFILCLIFAWFQSFSNPDSLYFKLKNHKEKKQHFQLAQTQIDLAKYYYFTEKNYDSTLYYTQKAVAYFTQKKRNKKLGYAYKLMGYAYTSGEKYESALQIFDSALVYLQPPQQMLSILQVYTNKGIAYNFVDNPSKAIKAFEKALQIGYELKDTSQIIINSLNTGIMYNIDGQISEAVDYLINGIKLAKQTHDSTNLIKCYIELGDIYLEQDNIDQAETYYLQALDMLDTATYSRAHVSLYDVLGYVKEQQNQFDQAEDWYKKAYLISNQIDYKSGKAQLLYRIGHLHKEKQDWQTALSFYKSALEVEIQIGSISDQLVVKNEIAAVYNQLKKYNKAEQLLKSVVQQAKDANLIRPRKQAHKLLSQNYKLTGAAASALEHYEAFRYIEDSIYNVQQLEIVENMRVRYETAEKEQTIIKLNTEKKLKGEKIKRQQQLLWSIIAGSVFIVIILILLYLQNKRKVALKRLQTEQQLFRAQLNPHFIFNALNAIKGYIIDHKTLEAADFLTDFSSLMRQTLESSIDEINSLQSEIELLTAYLKLQQMRLENKFQFHIETDSRIVVEDIKFPAILLQPFVENAIEHGMKNGGDMVAIRFNQEKNRLIITLEDNGPGIKNSELNGKKHRSRGMEIIQKRLNRMNKIAGWHVKYSVVPVNKNNNTGTRVTLDFPLLYFYK
ncbi:MAG: tetratricopeptide repeat protein [Salinivirgaceae bacterium]|jgi:tetratricopeptide (TPR) repeat protein|nr:tetratricopeptide repeat protein [Salinivirgaceae bacterium]